MNTKTLRIYLIAGEPSGDFLGGQLMQSLISQYPGTIEFFGIGGHQMEKEGLRSLFPMSELSMMGFVEIIPHIPHLLKRISDTVTDIRKTQPDIVITIDSPGFTCRVAKQLRLRSFPLVHYVAPSVWAYKPGRAKKFAHLFDHLLTLLPFEPPYFEKEGLGTTFVGHPVVEHRPSSGHGEAFKVRYHIPTQATILLALPGSRIGEVKRLLPIYMKTFIKLAQRVPSLYVVIPTLPHLKSHIETLLVEHAVSVPILLIDSTQEKQDALAAAHLALVKSGTATLEIAMAGIPMIVAYKMSFFSYWLIKWMAHIQYASLINLILNRPIIPEYLQHNCTPEKLSHALWSLTYPSPIQQHQLRETHQALIQLGYEQHHMPSQKAAATVLSMVS